MPSRVFTARALIPPRDSITMVTNETPTAVQAASCGNNSHIQSCRLSSHPVGEKDISWPAAGAGDQSRHLPSRRKSCRLSC